MRHITTTATLILAGALLMAGCGATQGNSGVDGGRQTGTDARTGASDVHGGSR